MFTQNQIKVSFKEYKRLRGDRQPQSKQILLNGKRVGEIEYNAHYARNPWTICLDGIGRIVDGNYDCFSLLKAKEIAKKRVETLYVNISTQS